ncbi:MAG: glucosylglycerol hydrolase [Halorhabdus sp.]
METKNCTLLDQETEELLEWHAAVIDRHDQDFRAAKEIVTRLGTHYEDGVTEVGFWTPVIVEEGVPEEDVSLEILTPTEDVTVFEEDGEQTLTVERERVPLRRQGEFHWGVIEGMRPGTREQFGSLYQLVYEADGEYHEIYDPLAYSVPFGPYGPSELYDLHRLDEERPDREYFQTLGTDDEAIPTTEDDGIPRIDPATSMVEIHPGTATESGSLGGLARRYEEIGRKQRAAEELSPAERTFVGYDAIQVMPIEPIAQHPERHDFWTLEETERDDGGEEVRIDVEAPEQINWGYDIIIHAFSAPNPTLLGSGRPHELVDFIAACHTMPRPIRIVFDLALGHADDGARRVLNDQFFEGPGMYGQELDYHNPVVRAIILELQRRKMDFGADGIRVDGAQDFTYYDEERGEEVHDDAFLAEMNEVVQAVGGQQYRPWMIYEDGRPWPRGDWELASTYRELIKQHPHAFQWSPITFAHNKPALLTFWASKWWRVYEVADFGSNWITGVANHDTLRRGTQQPVPEGWEEDPINPYLGEDAPEIIDEAYDSPAANALMHCVLPGVPMDFLNANQHAPWAFIRDTEADWNVKVVAEEANFVDWHLPEEHFQNDQFFPRLKQRGFESADELDHFMHVLGDVGEATDWDLEAMARTLTALGTPMEGEAVTAADLEAFSFEWVEDVAEFANLSNWRDAQDDDRTAFTLAVREFRQSRPWLRSDVDVEGEEVFEYVHPADGTIVYYALRESPNNDEQVLFAGNMEGNPVEVSPEFLAEQTPRIPTEGWTVELAPPSLETDGETIELDNGDAVVWTRDL